MFFESPNYSVSQQVDTNQGIAFYIYQFFQNTSNLVDLRYGRKGGIGISGLASKLMEDVI